MQKRLIAAACAALLFAAACADSTNEVSKQEGENGDRPSTTYEEIAPDWNKMTGEQVAIFVVANQFHGCNVQHLPLPAMPFKTDTGVVMAHVARMALFHRLQGKPLQVVVQNSSRDTTPGIYRVGVNGNVMENVAFDQKSAQPELVAGDRESYYVALEAIKNLCLMWVSTT